MVLNFVCTLALFVPLLFPKVLHYLPQHHDLRIHYNLQDLEHPLQFGHLPHLTFLLVKLGDDHRDRPYQVQYGTHITVIN